MTQHDALLAAVCAAPDDDLPRLVYADWCEENGQPERAEFIRVQIELTKGAKGKQLVKLQQREKELLAEHDAKWTEPFLELTDDFREDPIRFHRGFVEAISINDELLDEHGDELFRLAPIRTLLMGDQDGFNDLHKCKLLLRITTLDLAVSSLDSGRGSVKFFQSKNLANLTTLIATGYDDNGHLDLRGLEAIGTSKHFTKLRHLDISNNWLFNSRGIADADFAALQSLGRLPALIELHVAGTGLGEHAVRLAAEDWLARLRVLELDSNSISDAGARALAESPHLEDIERLNLMDNIVHDDDGETPLSDEMKRLLKRRFGKRVLL
jgi:uncharacterized protein (TIGR02996 family)